MGEAAGGRRLAAGSGGSLLMFGTARCERSMCTPVIPEQPAQVCLVTRLHVPAPPHLAQGQGF